MRVHAPAPFSAMTARRCPLWLLNGIVKQRRECQSLAKRTYASFPGGLPDAIAIRGALRACICGVRRESSVAPACRHSHVHAPMYASAATVSNIAYCMMIQQYSILKENLRPKNATLAASHSGPRQSDSPSIAAPHTQHMHIEYIILYYSISISISNKL